MPETTTALTLRYIEEHEATADRYLRSMLRFFMFDLHPHESFELVRTFTTETVGEIRDFEGAEVASRIDVALRRPIERAILEVTIVPVDDEEADADLRALPYRFTWPY